MDTEKPAGLAKWPAGNAMGHLKILLPAATKAPAIRSCIAGADASKLADMAIIEKIYDIY